MTVKKWRPWLPPIFFTAVGIVMFIVYLCRFEFDAVIVMQYIAGFAVPFAIPLIGLAVKREFSPLLTINVGLLVFFGIYIEKTFDVYAIFSGYDKVLHTNFGFIGTAIVFTLMLRWGGDKMNDAGVLFTLILSVLGLGAAWEFFEYIGTWFTHRDLQQWMWVVEESIEAGYIAGNPLDDTIGDLIVTVIGSSAFCILYIVDGTFGKKIFKKLYGEPDHDYGNKSVTLADNK